MVSLQMLSGFIYIGYFNYIIIVRFRKNILKKIFGVFFFMVNVVKKGLKVEILPDKNMEHSINQNIGNARFIWNNILSRYNYIYIFFVFTDIL